MPLPIKSLLKRRLGLPIPLQLFFFLAAVLNAVALSFTIIEKHLQRPWPYTMMSPGDPRATDLMFAVPIFHYVHTAEFFNHPFQVPFMYPAALAPLFGALLSFGRPDVVLKGCIFFFAVAAALLFGLYLRRRAICDLTQSIVIPAGAILLSYPLWFEQRQGNVEIFVWVLVTLAVWLFSRERWQASAVLIGIAIAMKMFPFVFLGLFLSRKRYTPVITAAAIAAVSTFLSLLYLGPTVALAWHGTVHNLAYYQQTVPTVFRRELAFDHSLFSVCKVFVHFLLHHRAATENFTGLLHGYMIFVAVAGCLLYFLRIRFLPFPNQVIALTICSILLPPVSYDYTLLHVYIAWALLVVIALQRGDLKTPGLTPLFICLAVATTVGTEFIFGNQAMGGQVKAIALLTALIVSVRYPLPSKPSFQLPSRE